mgnify:CR=1 FL=1
MAAIRMCLDAYALIEIARGNSSFAEYINSNFVITDLTLAEFYAALLLEDGEKKADYWFNKLERYSLPIPKEIIIHAIKFRQEHKKKRISFFDAIGYIFAIKNACYFVTGDKEFEGLPNVEFKKD